MYLKPQCKNETEQYFKISKQLLQLKYLRQLFKIHYQQPSVVVQICNPSISKTEAGRVSQVLYKSYHNMAMSKKIITEDKLKTTTSSLYYQLRELLLIMKLFWIKYALANQQARWSFAFKLCLNSYKQPLVRSQIQFIDCCQLERLKVGYTYKVLQSV